MMKLVILIIAIFFVMSLIPVIFAIPLIVIGKFSSFFMDASINKKDRISLAIALLVSILLALKTYISPSIDAQIILCAIVFLSFSFHFASKEIRHQGGFKTKGIFDQRYEYFAKGFIGAWKTKYHWGTMIQSVSILYGIILQIIE